MPEVIATGALALACIAVAAASWRINRAARRDRELREHFARQRAAESGSNHHHNREDWMPKPTPPSQENVPVAIGQTRVDKRGGAIIIKSPHQPQRWACEYPQLDGEVSILGDQTILQLYPTVVSEAR